MTAIEIYEPYVNMFGLPLWYDTIIIADARTSEWPQVDLVILGDVLEHMEHDEALALWQKALEHADKAVILSLPIVESIQGAWEGNEHETHLHQWTDEQVLAELTGITAGWTGTQIGVYLAEVEQDD